MKQSPKSKMGSASDKLPGTLYVVATPIGNSADWTRRATEILSEVDVVAAEDTRVLKRELAKIKINPRRVLSHRDHNEEASTKGLLDMLMQGQSVAVSTDAGTPLISDPGTKIVREALKAGIRVIPVPGPSSLTTALSVSALGGHSFFFGGFLPPEQGARRKILKRSQRAADSLIFFEAPHRLREMLADAEEILGAQTEAMICRELTKPYEEILHNSITEIRKYFGVNEPRGEIVVLFKGTPDDLLDSAETEAEVKKLLKIGKSASDILDELQPVSEVPRKQLYNVISRMKNS